MIDIDVALYFDILGIIGVAYLLALVDYLKNLIRGRQEIDYLPRQVRKHTQRAVYHTCIHRILRHIADAHFKIKYCVSDVKEYDKFAKAHKELQDGHYEIPEGIRLQLHISLLSCGIAVAESFLMLHSKRLNYAYSRKYIVQYRVCLRSRLPAFMEELMYLSPNKRKRKADERNGNEYKQKQNPKVVC